MSSPILPLMPEPTQIRATTLIRRLSRTPKNSPRWILFASRSPTPSQRSRKTCSSLQTKRTASYDTLSKTQLPMPPLVLTKNSPPNRARRSRDYARSWNHGETPHHLRSPTPPLDLNQSPPSQHLIPHICLSHKLPSLQPPSSVAIDSRAPCIMIYRPIATSLHVDMGLHTPDAIIEI